MPELAPDCRSALKKAHQRLDSLAQVGKLLRTPEKPEGYSAAAISTLLKGSYAAKDIAPIEAAIRANIMRSHVPCPLLGKITAEDCSTNQAHANARNRNSGVRVKLARACPICPQGQMRGDDNA